MSTGNNDIRFEPLPLKRRELVSVEANQYCVRSASGESREIKADTAYEAFLKSGLQDAIKIERRSSLGGAIIEKAGLVPEQVIPETEASLHDSILRRRNPIISATELDELINALRKQSAAEQASGTAESVAPFVPEPVDIPVPEGSPSAIGMDVHGDGFDEIIPAALPPVTKPVTAKPQETLEPQKSAAPEIPPAAAPDLPPERELSPEEVQKLLDGK